MSSVLAKDLGPIVSHLHAALGNAENAGSYYSARDK